MHLTFGIMIMSGVEDGKLYNFELDPHSNAIVRIGRASSNELVLNTDEAVSREHAVIFWKEGSWWIEDRDSKNGLFVNRGSIFNTGIRIKGIVQLDGGELIRIGKTWIRFQPQDWERYA